MFCIFGLDTDDKEDKEKKAEDKTGTSAETEKAAASAKSGKSAETDTAVSHLSCVVWIGVIKIIQTLLVLKYQTILLYL